MVVFSQGCSLGTYAGGWLGVGGGSGHALYVSWLTVVAAKGMLAMGGCGSVGAGRPMRLKPLGMCAQAVADMRAERARTYDPRLDCFASLVRTVEHAERQRLPSLDFEDEYPSRPHSTTNSRPQSPSLPLGLSSAAIGQATAALL